MEILIAGYVVGIAISICLFYRYGRHLCRPNYIGDPNTFPVFLVVLLIVLWPGTLVIGVASVILWLIMQKSTPALKYLDKKMIDIFSKKDND